MIRLLLIFLFTNIFGICHANDNSENIFELLDTGDSEVINDNEVSEILPLYQTKNISEQNYSYTKYSKAQIIVLNKITAKSSEIVINQNQPAFVGNIEILLKQCLQNLDPYYQESRVQLSIMENKIDDDPQEIFHGWLFSSAPSLSTLEHPVYDIFIKSCNLK